MLQAPSGGWMFNAGRRQMLRRCLPIATAQSTYSAPKQELTEDFVKIVRQALRKSPVCGRRNPVGQ